MVLWGWVMLGALNLWKFPMTGQPCHPTEHPQGSGPSAPGYSEETSASGAAGDPGPALLNVARFTQQDVQTILDRNFGWPIEAYRH